MLNFRSISLSGLALAALASTAVAFVAEDAKEVTTDGTVVTLSSSELVLKCKKDSKESTHAIGAGAKMTLDGKDCKVADLKPGTKVRVTTSTADKKAVTNIEGISKNELFANTHDGTFVSATSTKLVMTGADGKEHSHSITDDTTVTCDKKDCKASDLKAGTKIRVTTKKSDEAAVTCIEAIVKDGDFAR